MIFVSLLRGLVFYIALMALGTGLGWLVLPWRYDISPSSPHMMMAIMGGGAVLVLSVIIMCSLSNIQK